MDIALHIDPADVSIAVDASVSLRGSTLKALNSIKTSSHDTRMESKNTACVNGGCDGSAVNHGCNNYGC